MKDEDEDEDELTSVAELFESFPATQTGDSSANDDDFI